MKVINLKNLLLAFGVVCIIGVISGCNDDGGNVPQPDDGTGMAPVLNNIVIESFDSNSITLRQPSFFIQGDPVPTVEAYIGYDGTISVTGNVVSNSFEGGVDVSSASYMFQGLTWRTVYRIIVIAENEIGYSVEEFEVTLLGCVYADYEADYILQAKEVTFTTELSGATIYVGSSTNVSDTSPASWIEGSSFTFSDSGEIKVFAKAQVGGADETKVFSRVYEVVTAFPGCPDDQPGNAWGYVDKTDVSIVAWITGSSDFNRGLDRSSAGGYDDESKAYGQNNGLLNLGNVGNIIFTFDKGIKDGPGYDFATFENGFLTNFGGYAGLFAEYGYIEVSSDGVNFLRFDTMTGRDPASVPAPSGMMIGWNTTLDYGIMGRYPSGKGDQFDLEWLKNKKEVLNGTVDLDHITHVRVIDIIGIEEDRLTDTINGPDSDHKANIKSIGGTYLYDSFDSMGNVIFDDYFTTGTGGMDFDAIGIINEAD